MKKSALIPAVLSFVLMTGSAVAADVTFAVKGPPGGKASFSYVPVTGGLPKTKVVTTVKEVDGVTYYVWKTSIAKIAHVCGLYVTPTASAKCVGEFGKKLQVKGNFVVLK